MRIFNRGIHAKLDTLLENDKLIITLLISNSKKEMALLDQLTADVANETTVDASVETLLTNLSAQITAAGTDPVALKALTDQMEANAAALSAAITANTPSAPAGN